METNIEEWFDIPNFEGIYQVTRSGKIKKIGKKSKYKDLIYPDKMMKHNTHTNKYKYITFMVDGRMSDVHGIPITHIAKMYDMGSTIIWMIVKRRKWASIG